MKSVWIGKKKCNSFWAVALWWLCLPINLVSHICMGIGVAVSTAIMVYMWFFGRVFELTPSFRSPEKRCKSCDDKDEANDSGKPEPIIKRNSANDTEQTPS